MKTPEIIVIPHERLIHQTRNSYQEYILDIAHHECVCGHFAVVHKIITMRNLYRLQDELYFESCQASDMFDDCKCDMYKRDNLIYLEKLANRQALNEVKS